MGPATYEARAKSHGTAIGRRLLSIMAEKKTNLSISVDMPSPDAILKLLASVGSKICCVKTHIDTIAFDSLEEIRTFTTELEALAKEHSFLIFEDRKFADIGNTVKHQYGGGIYKIARWSHITNAHTVPGPGIIDGLREVANECEDDRGLLLLGEMSSAGTLSGGVYLEKTIEMARKNKDFVMGFIAMGAVARESESDDWIVMTPGVNMGSAGDGLGQQYKTPDLTIRINGADVIIVGRGILNAADPAAEAERYRAAGWEAYKNRCKVD
ncbi:Orotidine 5'-phosphate decarboxylase domain-containing protein [Geopyxis carbonaria]|nr:Orotidine 5'-phosphate decarboxylase domain-containing protein [Geopyxis carbonaria]